MALSPGPPREGRISWDAAKGEELQLRLDAGDGVLAMNATPPVYADPKTGLIGKIELGLSPKLARTLVAAPPAPIAHAALLERKDGRARSGNRRAAAAAASSARALDEAAANRNEAHSRRIADRGRPGLSLSLFRLSGADGAGRSRPPRLPLRPGGRGARRTEVRDPALSRRRAHRNSTRHANRDRRPQTAQGRRFRARAKNPPPRAAAPQP